MQVKASKHIKDVIQRRLQGEDSDLITVEDGQSYLKYDTISLNFGKDHLFVSFKYKGEEICLLKKYFTSGYDTISLHDLKGLIKVDITTD